MPVVELPIFCYFDKQRFTQFGAMDCANWYGVAVETGKKKQALYPAMGRKHINFFNQNRLIFAEEPRQIFKTIDYMYVIVQTTVYQVDKFFNVKSIGTVALGTEVWFDWLAVGTTIYGMLTDQTHIYVITENGTTVTYAQVTDGNAPAKPTYVAEFGNRFVVSEGNTPNFYLTEVNLVGTPATYFTVAGAALFNRATGVIRQFGVLHNQLYIFCDFNTDVWANIPTQFTVAGVTTEFPWKINSSYNWDYGIQDPFSLSISFGRMVWLAKNADGLVSFLVSTGQQPEDISSQAINVMLEDSIDQEGLSPFLTNESDGFIYQYENTIFYRISAGKYMDFGILDLQDSANAVEYNFDTKTWSRVIELNGERNRIQKHVFLANRHLVTVSGDPAIYEMAGNIYYNETINPNQPNNQAADAFLQFPMRYELVTSQIYLPDYAEFIDYYVEIDFVFGDMTFFRNDSPFANTVFIVDESSTPGVPQFLVAEDGSTFIIQDGTNFPVFGDNHYTNLFNPYIELFYSDDGGVTFEKTAGQKEFSPLGQYRWRMRWYELGASRNRCYKLVCVSSAPIIVLGAVRDTVRISGGAN